MPCFPGKGQGSREGRLHLSFFSKPTGVWGREGVWLPSLHYAKEGRTGMSSWKDQKTASSQTVGQDVEVLVTAIKRSQVLGQSARNTPGWSEAASHISVVGMAWFVCSSVLSKEEGGGGGPSPSPQTSSAPCNSRRLETPASPGQLPQSSSSA